MNHPDLISSMPGLPKVQPRNFQPGEAQAAHHEPANTGYARGLSRWLGFSMLALLALSSSGCVLHTYETRDDLYTDYQSNGYQNGYSTVSAEASVGYYGGHLIPESNGGGWCFQEGRHYHSYRPDYSSYYTDNSGFYAYQGPVSLYYYGYHPIPAEDGGGWCNRHGRHVHRYHPDRNRNWHYEGGRRYYWYDRAGRHHKAHPAEPAWVSRGRGVGATPAAAPAHSGRGRPAPPIAGRAQPAPPRGSAARALPAPARLDDNNPRVRPYGWRPPARSVDLGEAGSEHGGRVITPARAVPPSYQAAPAAPSFNARPVAPSYRAAPAAPSFNARPVAPSYRAAPAAPSFNARPVAPSYRAAPAAPSFHARPVAPSYRAAPAAPSFNARPVAPSATRSGGHSSTGLHTSGVRVTSPNSRSATRVTGVGRRVGTARADRARDGARDDRERRGSDKVKVGPVRRAPAPRLHLKPNH